MQTTQSIRPWRDTPAHLRPQRAILDLRASIRTCFDCVLLQRCETKAENSHRRLARAPNANLPSILQSVSGEPRGGQRASSGRGQSSGIALGGRHRSCSSNVPRCLARMRQDGSRR